MTEDSCPICERASEMIFRVEEFDTSLQHCIEESNMKIKAINLRVDKVDSRIDSLLMASIILFASALVSGCVAVYSNIS